MTTLYALTSEYHHLAELADAGEEEVSADFEAALAGFEFDEASKVDGYVQIIRTFEAREAAKRAEARRLVDAAALDGRKVERLKGRLLEHLQQTERKSLQTSLYGIRRQLNGQAKVSVADVQALPAELRREVVTMEPDRAAILLLVEQGRPLPPGVSVSRGEHLRVY